MDLLADEVHNYNASCHGTKKFALREAVKDPFEGITDTVRSKQTPVNNSKAGDFVRISKFRKTFKRLYEENSTNQVFIVPTVF